MYGLDITDAVKRADCVGLKSDTRALPFQTQTFDLTFSIGVIEHFSGSAKAVAEHARVTRPDGWVFLITPHLSPKTVRRYLTHWLRGDHKRGTFEEIRGRNLTRQVLHGYFKDAGLVNIQTGCYGDVWVPGISQIPIVQSILRRTVGNHLANFVYAVGQVPE